MEKYEEIKKLGKGAQGKDYILFIVRTEVTFFKLYLNSFHRNF